MTVALEHLHLLGQSREPLVNVSTQVSTSGCETWWSLSRWKRYWVRVRKRTVWTDDGVRILNKRPVDTGVHCVGVLTTSCVSSVLNVEAWTNVCYQHVFNTHSICDSMVSSRWRSLFVCVHITDTSLCFAVMPPVCVCVWSDHVMDFSRICLCVYFRPSTIPDSFHFFPQKTDDNCTYRMLNSIA